MVVVHIVALLEDILVMRYFRVSRLSEMSEVVLLPYCILFEDVYFVVGHVTY
tara:strand:+ start:432 stop:587 length:156 start_codon:yes stop_codon:yes gene_type:complete